MRALPLSACSRPSCSNTGTHTHHRSTCQLLHLTVVSVLESNEALGNLEEIAIRLVRCKINAEGKVAIGRDLLLSR